MKNQFITKGAYQFESGEELDRLEITYHTFGERNEKSDNIIWVFHALSANSDVSEWWPNLFGRSNILDPEQYFIICANTIGSPYGSSCPTDLHFPKITVRDTVRAFILLAEELSINRVHLALGGSFGGNQALEFALMFKGTIDHLVLIASSAKESAWAIAVHETQRLAMKSDPSFGQPDGGREGIKAARAIGMLTYRTSQMFIDRQTDTTEKLDDFMASSYINYQGEKFANRFTALSYYYLTKCLDSHDVGRNRGGVKVALNKLRTRTLIIGIDSDLLIPTSLQKEMHAHFPNAQYAEIHSESGHDGFLLEGEKLKQLIKPFLNETDRKIEVHKFGGKSLANGMPLDNALKIIQEYASTRELAIIVSARGNTTDKLISIYHHAVSNKPYASDLQELLHYQMNDDKIDLNNLQLELNELLNAAAIIGIDNEEIKAKIVSYGELLSAQAISIWLKLRGLKAVFIDARTILKTRERNGQHHIVNKISRQLTTELFKTLPSGTIPIITGFITSDLSEKTTNLGRNGSNYTAALIASYVHAKVMYNWTDVDGIFSANPKYVADAKRIDHLSYREANELANLGAQVLHSKTILPLIENNIPLLIKNSTSPKIKGTRIDDKGSTTGIKSVTSIENVSLIGIEGGGLMGKVGIDSRIFTRLGNNNISVRLISQASSERGIGFVVDQEHAPLALQVLQEEFKSELNNQYISSISKNDNVCIIGITGRHNYALEKAIQGLRKNKIWIHLFSNSINGESISMVIDRKHMTKALNVVHEYVV